jgi:hypothetical protein
MQPKSPHNRALAPLQETPEAPPLAPHNLLPIDELKRCGALEDGLQHVAHTSTCFGRSALEDVRNAAQTATAFIGREERGVRISFANPNGRSTRYEPGDLSGLDGDAEPLRHSVMLARVPVASIDLTEEDATCTEAVTPPLPAVMPWTLASTQGSLPFGDDEIFDIAGLADRGYRASEVPEVVEDVISPRRSGESFVGGVDDYMLNRAHTDYCAVRYESPLASPRGPCLPFEHSNFPQSPIRDVWAKRSPETEADPSPVSNGRYENDSPVAALASAISTPDLAKIECIPDLGLGSARASVRSSSAPRELGRPYSPPVVLAGDLLDRLDSPVSKPSRFGVPGASPSNMGMEDIEVIFDPTIGCYYDPKSNKYYTLEENANGMVMRGGPD